MSGYTLVTDPAGAETLVRRWRGVERLAVDTEFVRERTFSAQLCLVQLSDGDHIACVDVLALAGLGPVAGLLTDPAILKVFHSARQDLEILYEQLGQVPGPVWDTQVAAALTGHPDQVGYGALVEAELGIQLAKGHARTDWSRRPLSDAQLRYAADDVRHLLAVSDRLASRLDASGRADWARTESQALLDESLYAFDSAGAWRRIKGARQLEGEVLSRLVALAAWREEEARRTNRPRRWILADQGLLDLAREAPSDPEAVARLDSVPPAVARRHGRTLVETMADAAGSPPPEQDGPGRLEPAQEKLVKVLMKQLRQTAETKNISASLIAARREVERLVAGDRDLALLSGWRREVAGEELLAFVEGREES